MKWRVPFIPIRKLKLDEREMLLPIKMEGSTEGKCDFCGAPKIDCCYNCEKPICEKHSMLYVFSENPMIVLGICPECEMDLTLEGKIMERRTIDEMEIEEQIKHTRYRVKDGNFFYWAPLRQRWYRIVKMIIIPNYGDVELAYWYEKEGKACIPRLRGEKRSRARFKGGEIKEMDRNPDKVYYPKGDVVCFELEDGCSIYTDSGEDPGGVFFESMRKLVELFEIQPKKGLTNLKGIFDNNLKDNVSL